MPSHRGGGVPSWEESNTEIIVKPWVKFNDGSAVEICGQCSVLFRVSHRRTIQDKLKGETGPDSNG